MLGLRILFLLLLLPFSAFAVVSVQNGNYSESFYDASEGGHLELGRHYNSQSFTGGIFGYGWGSLMETRLTSVNGMLVMVEEIPGGGRSHYIPEKNKNMSVVVDKIIQAVKKDKQKQSDMYYAKLKSTLLSDMTVLIEFAKRYRLQAPVPEGTTLRCVEKPHESMRKTSAGYIRTRPANGVKERFDNDGKLLYREFQNGDHLKLSYNKYGVLEGVTDNLGRYIKFYINDKGLLEKAVLYNKKAAIYKYDDRGDLVESRDVDNNQYRYKYDTYHNLVELLSVPKNKGDKPQQTLMKYDVNRDKIVYQKTPDGWETFIEYSDNDAGSEYYEAIGVIRKFGREVHSEKYEYWKRPKPDGTRYVYKTKEKIGNSDKTIIYTMCCNTPLVVNENGKVTRYEYDKNGRLRKKVFPSGRIINVKYDGRGYISHIINNGSPYVFGYDEKGNIIFAGTKEVKFKIKYDRLGRVSSIYDNKKRAFAYRYDDKNRIIRIKSKDGVIAINPEAEGEGRFMAKGAAKDPAWEIRKVYQDYTDVMSIFRMLEIDN